MQLGWSVFFVLLYLYRVAISVAAEVLVRQVTSLGDSASYQGKSVTLAAMSVDDSTDLTRALGALFNALSFGNPYMINIWFQTLAFIGIYKFMMALAPQSRKIVALLVLLPSFNVWSSVASKEAVVVFAVGLLCVLIIELFQHRARVRWYYIFAVVVLYIYKPHFLPAFLFIIAALVIGRHLRQRSAFILVSGLLSVSLLYPFRDKIDKLSFAIIPHFLGTGDSTREPFWVEQYDVFRKAPEGMFQAFYGPTLHEAMTGNILHAVAFVESFIIVVVLGYCLLRRLPELPVYNFMLWLFGSFWILFASYPLGIMNPGTAIRYRTDYLLLIFLLFSLAMSRDAFVRWQNGCQVRSDGRVVP